MGSDTVFDRILRGEVPADIVYEDEWSLAFRDVRPQAPVHVLVIPRQKLAGLQDAEASHAEVLGRLLVAARAVAQREGIAASGFRCVINAGPEGGQEVHYLHIHVLGGRQMQWPPG